MAIAWTTPVLLGLFSVVTLMAERLIKHQTMPVHTAAWYTKELLTFGNASVGGDSVPHPGSARGLLCRVSGQSRAQGDPDFEKKMQKADEIMHRYRNTLRALAE